MGKFLILLSALFIFAHADGSGFEREGKISLGSLLDEMISRDALTRFPEYKQNR